MDDFQRLSPEDWAHIRELAKDLYNSKLIPPGLDSKEKVQAIILAGREMGIPVMAAIRGIQIVQGVPVITPALMLALAFRSKSLAHYEIVFSSDQVATVRVQRQGCPVRTESFSMEDAERFGFAEQAAWIEQPRALLRWQAIALALRFDFADLFFGLFLPHEIPGATSDDMGTAYAQAADIHAESPWRPSKAILAARAVAAAHTPAPALEAPRPPAPAPLEDLATTAVQDFSRPDADAPAHCVGVGDGCGQDAPPSPFREGEPHATTKEGVLAHLAEARAEEVTSSPAAERLAGAIAQAVVADATRQPAQPRSVKCWACGDLGRIPIDSDRPELGETDCLLCRAQEQAEEVAQTRALESPQAESAQAEAAPAPAEAPGGQRAQTAAVPAAPVGEKLFATEGVGELQMQIYEIASKILPPGADLRGAMGKWILKNYEVAGGLPGLVAVLEQRGEQPADKLIEIRARFQAEYEKRVQAKVAEAAQEDPRGK